MADSADSHRYLADQKWKNGELLREIPTTVTQQTSIEAPGAMLYPDDPAALLRERFPKSSRSMTSDSMNVSDESSLADERHSVVVEPIETRLPYVYRVKFRSIR